MSRRYVYYLPLAKQSRRYCVFGVIIVVCGVIHVAACGWVVLSHVICDGVFGPRVKVIPCPRIYETCESHLILSVSQPNRLGQLYSIVRGHIGRIHLEARIAGQCQLSRSHFCSLPVVSMQVPVHTSQRRRSEATTTVADCCPSQRLSCKSNSRPPQTALLLGQVFQVVQRSRKSWWHGGIEINELEVAITLFLSGPFPTN